MSTVVVATDLSRVSTRAVEVGTDLARRLSARLLLLNVLDLGRLSGRGRHDRVDQARAEREPVLLELVRVAREAGVEAEFLLWQGSPVEAITDAATSEGAEMIVVGSHRRRGPERTFLGSVSDGLVRTAGVPVLIVPADDTPASEAQATPA
ncbi:MAG: universal stress protein [Candidatus Limnocylindrales bacterium]